MTDVTKTMPFEFSDEQKQRLLTLPPPGLVKAPTVVIFYVYEEPKHRLHYTGFSLEPSYTFLEGMFERGVHYSVRVAVRNIVTDVEELSRGEVTFTGGETFKIPLGFHWPPPPKKTP